VIFEAGKISSHPPCDRAPQWSALPAPSTQHCSPTVVTERTRSRYRLRSVGDRWLDRGPTGNQGDRRLSPATLSPRIPCSALAVCSSRRSTQQFARCGFTTITPSSLVTSKLVNPAAPCAWQVVMSTRRWPAGSCLGGTVVTFRGRFLSTEIRRVPGAAGTVRISGSGSFHDERKPWAGVWGSGWDSAHILGVTLAAGSWFGGCRGRWRWGEPDGASTGTPC
jgi:hypothetical protein